MVPPRDIYTHDTPNGAERPDRLHVTPDLSGQKVGMETVRAAFTDHLAVCMHIHFEAPLVRRGRGLWKMNIKLLEETSFQDRLQQQWSLCVQQGKNYTDKFKWWERYAKKKFRYLFIKEATERKREAAINENFYYTCIHDVLKDFNHNRENAVTLNHI